MVNAFGIPQTKAAHLLVEGQDFTSFHLFDFFFFG